MPPTWKFPCLAVFDSRKTLSSGDKQDAKPEFGARDLQCCSDSNQFCWISLTKKQEDPKLDQPTGHSASFSEEQASTFIYVNLQILPLRTGADCGALLAERHLLAGTVRDLPTVPADNGTFSRIGRLVLGPLSNHVLEVTSIGIRELIAEK